MYTLVQVIDRHFYPKFERNWDDALLRQSILVHLRSDQKVLDLGAGAGIISQMNFRGLGAHITGVDLDPRVLQNPWLDEAKIGNADTIPFAAESFDLVFSDNVLEHLDNPQKVFAEVHRVLRPNGIFIFKTPNRFHYVPIIAKITPHRFHEYISKRRGRTGADVFPTRYLANSSVQIKRLAKQTDFKIDELLQFEGRPEYLRVWGPAYLGGLAYERLVNAFDFLSPFRVLLIGVLRKSSQSQSE